MGLFLLYVNNCRIWLWTVVFVTVYFRVFLYCITVRVWRTSTGLHRPAQSHLGPTPLPRHPISAQAQESGSCLSFARQIPTSSPSFTLSLDRPQTYIIEQSHRSLVSGPVRWMCPRPVSSPHHSWGCWWMLLPAPDVGTCLACHPTGGWLLLGEGIACAKVTLGSWFILLSWGSHAFFSIWPLPWMQLHGW